MLVTFRAQGREKEEHLAIVAVQDLKMMREVMKAPTSEGNDTLSPPPSVRRRAASAIRSSRGNVPHDPGTATCHLQNCQLPFRGPSSRFCHHGRFYAAIVAHLELTMRTVCPELSRNPDSA